jgi:Type VI secretion system, TssC, VipB
MLEQEKNQGAQERARNHKPELPDWDTATAILDNYDGLEDLLTPLADDIDRFSGNAKKKKKYLSDDSLNEERRQLRDRLKALSGLLSHPDVNNAQQLRATALDKLDNNESLIKKNLLKITEASRDLERTYRELETFYRNAAPQKVKNLTLLNIHREVLTDPDRNALYNEIETRLLAESKKVDQKKAYSILVIPGLWESKQPKTLIERYTKLAGEANLSFLTDFEDTDSAKESLRSRSSKKWQGITGSEAFHSKLILFANHLILRGKHEDLDEENELRGSPAMAIAGKMYAEKISQPVAGEKHGSVSGVQGLAFNVVQNEVGDFAEEGINSMMNAYEKDMAYEACTAFNGGEYGLKRYAVVRVFDYVNRVLRHFLGKVTHQQLDRSTSNRIRESIQDFLDVLAEQKIITKGRVNEFAWNPRQPDRIDVKIGIQPLWAVRTFVYALNAEKGNAKSEAE